MIKKLAKNKKVKNSDRDFTIPSQTQLNLSVRIGKKKQLAKLSGSSAFL